MYAYLFTAYQFALRLLKQNLPKIISTVVFTLLFLLILVVAEVITPNIVQDDWRFYLQIFSKR